MKTSLMLGLALVGLVPAHAQIFRPHGVGGVAVGVSAVHRHGDGRSHGWHVGTYHGGTSVFVESNWLHHSHRRGYPYWHHDRPIVAYPHRHYYLRYRSPVYYRDYVYRDFHYPEVRPDYRGTGLFWGSVLGAIVGHNSGTLRHEAWRGAAYGAGLGLILGSVAENNARRSEQREREAEQRPAVVPAPEPVASALPPVGVIRQSAAPSSSMASANALFGRN